MWHVRHRVRQKARDTGEEPVLGPPVSLLPDSKPMHRIGYNHCKRPAIPMLERKRKSRRTSGYIGTGREAIREMSDWRPGGPLTSAGPAGILGVFADLGGIDQEFLGCRKTGSRVVWWWPR
jgi:hypothetical protein